MYSTVPRPRTASRTSAGPRLHIAADGPLDFRSAGSCVSHDPEFFFPTSHGGKVSKREIAAKRICAGCPVLIALRRVGRGESEAGGVRDLGRDHRARAARGGAEGRAGVRGVVVTAGTLQRPTGAVSAAVDRFLDAGELDVVRGLAEGDTNPAIARRLRISEASVRRRLVCVCVKLGVGPDRAAIVGEAIRTGQLTVPVSGVRPERFDECLFDVLVLVARGRSNQEIAAELFLSVDAVKSRMQRLFWVLDARSRSHAVARGVQCGVLRLVPVRERARGSGGPP